MNDSTSASPASSSASDSDAFNTESARLYFGPVKTPERKFVASNKRLFPPAVPSLLRRSPRLSSPRPQPPPDPVDRESAAEEAEDIDLVAQLVNEVDVDDEDAEMSNSPLGTPSRDEGELEPDGKPRLLNIFSRRITIFTPFQRAAICASRQDTARN